MSKTKKYLMLLAAIGLIATAAGGVGTFASFSAETTNANNYFATGTLFLHNTANGGTTCTSESSTDNGVLVNPTGCNTLFTVNSVLPNTVYPATLALTNAGSLDASDIKFALGSTGCSEGTPTIATLNTAINSGDTVTSLDLVNVTQPLTKDTQIRLTDTAGSQVFTVTATTTPSGGAATVPVTSTLAAHNYTTATSALTLVGNFFGTPTLCKDLLVNVIETTDNTYATPSECSYGLASGSTCVFDPGFTLNDTGTGIGTALKTLTIASAINGNSAGKLNASKTRYFLIQMKAPSSLPNADQNDKITFDLRWHIDQ